MELNFTRFRLATFAVLLAAFFAWVEIATPRMTGVGRALAYSMVLFTAGAFILCFADFQYGMFPPKSLRPLIIAGGSALMILAIALIHSLQHAASLSGATPNIQISLYL